MRFTDNSKDWRDAYSCSAYVVNQMTEEEWNDYFFLGCFIAAAVCGIGFEMAMKRQEQVKTMQAKYDPATPAPVYVVED